MKLRESGMPEQDLWESLFDIEDTLDRLGVDETLCDVAELGCGYGTFTLPVARRIQGTLTSIDVDTAMVAITRKRAMDAALKNILVLERDVTVDGFGVASASQDGCLLFNILHGELPLQMLVEAARVVKVGGVLLVTHWRHDPATPRGPSLDIRPKPEHVLEWVAQSRLLAPHGSVIDLPPWHYGMRLRRVQ